MTTLSEAKTKPLPLGLELRATRTHRSVIGMMSWWKTTPAKSVIDISSLIFLPPAAFSFLDRKFYCRGIFLSFFLSSSDVLGSWELALCLISTWIPREMASNCMVMGWVSFSFQISSYVLFLNLFRYTTRASLISFLSHVPWCQRQLWLHGVDTDHLGGSDTTITTDLAHCVYSCLGAFLDRVCGSDSLLACTRFSLCFCVFCYFYSSFLKCVLLPIPPRIFPGFDLQFLFTKQHGWYLKLSLCVHNCGSGLD